MSHKKGSSPGLIIPNHIRIEEERKAKEVKMDLLPESQMKPLTNNENIPNYVNDQKELLESKSAMALKNVSIDKFKLSKIEDYEEEEAKKLIETHLGYERPIVPGHLMAVKIYVRPSEISYFNAPDGTTKALYRPESASAHDKFINCSALVISQGPDCYKGWRFEEHWFRKFMRRFFNKWMEPSTKVPWCKVGDWVAIPRNAGPQVNYRGVPVTVIPDDQVIMVLEDPSHVTRD